MSTFAHTITAIYQHVEPTSVTPFAVPVRERALHALIVVLARFWGDERSTCPPELTPPDADVMRRIEQAIQRKGNVFRPERMAGHGKS